MAHELCTSLRQGTFEKFHVRGTPGPGAHDAVTAHAAVRPRSPEYSFGKSARHHSAAADTPGPDAYQGGVATALLSKSFDSRHLTVPRAVFGTSARSGSPRAESPAPGHYDVFGAAAAVRPRSPSFSMGTAPRDSPLRNAAQPGPGAYSVPSALGRQPVSIRPSSAMVRFGTSARGDLRPDVVPGPGAYAPEGIDGIGGRAATSLRPRSATTRIGTGRRFDLRPSDTPGPAYSPEVRATRPRSPQYSFSRQHRDPDLHTRPRSPGPGAYADVDTLGSKAATTAHLNSPITKFGTSGRFAMPAHDGPAPGDYVVEKDVRFTVAPRTKFGTGERDLARPTDTPAPGTYVQTVDSVRPRSAAWRFGTGGRFALRGTDTPGPDAYGLPSKAPLHTRAPTTKFGSSSRDAGAPRVEAPGPQYDLDTSLRATRPSSARTRIGTSARFHANKDDLPGPGDYGLPAKPLRKAPAFSLRAR